MKVIQLTPEQTWPIRHQVMWPDQSIDYVKLPNDPEGNHYGLIIDEKLVSIVSLFELNNEIQFRKFATLPEEQGKGYGSFLLSHALNKNTNKGTQAIWCNARMEKSAYYQKFGLQSTSEIFSKGGVEYVIMKKIID